MRRRIDVAEVEAATKIRAKYLRALEHEDFGMLPGPTFVKTFLRTYAEYLGLDAQLLIEEYRAQHEPRESEIQPFVPASQRREHRPWRVPRPSGAPPGPGTAVLVAVAAVLVIFLILGITGGSGGGRKGSHAAPKVATNPRAKPAPRPAPVTTVTLRVVPVAPTYLCVDHGIGTPVQVDSIVTQPMTFHGKVVRINAGRSNIQVTVNGQPVQIPQSGFPIGYSFTPHNTVPLPPPQRPCIAR